MKKTNKIFALIEIAPDSFNKTEWDKKDNILRFDRVLDLPYPTSYGFIYNTLAEDNDPLDVFVLGLTKITAPLKVEIEIMGIIYFIDGGTPDHKIIAVEKEFYEKHTKDWDKEKLVDKIIFFLKVYKKNVEVQGIGTKNKAIEYYKKCKNI